MRNPLREIRTVGSVRGESLGDAMVNLNGHAAGNGRYSQGTPTQRAEALLYSEEACRLPWDDLLKTAPW